MKCEQIELPLFSPTGFGDLLHSRNITTLRVHVSPRLQKKWYVKLQRLDNSRVLVIPPFLENAPDEIKNALIEWARFPFKPRSNKREVGARRRTLEKLVWSYVETIQPSTARKKLVHPGSIRTEGVSFDLEVVLEELNKTYFDGTVKSFIRWGSLTSTTSYQENRVLRDGSSCSLITIAGVYNQVSVPRYALEGVVFHEMAHIVAPPFKKNGRRVVHGSEFSKVERRYEHFEKWRAWERTKLPRLARSLTRKHK